MTGTRLRTALIASGAFVAVLVPAACTGGDADSSVAVTGTNDACTIADDTLTAGQIDFEFTNKADKVNELYVVRANGDVVGEVEDVTNGTTRTLTADLVAGEYQVKCKPGQAGKGITSDFTVSGEGGTAVAEPDRTISFDAVDFTYEDLDLTDIATGDTIRFEMTNSGDQPHEFEVLNPDGDAVGEVAAVEPGETGGAVITFEDAGSYTYQCILVDPETDQKHSEMGMTGMFEVAAS